MRPLDLDADVRPMTLDDAVNEMKNRVYEAAVFFEMLEHVGHLCGNGHHVAQHIAQRAGEEVRERWTGPR